MDAGELIARADANMFEAFRMMTGHMPGGEVRERDGLLVVSSGLPTAMFNIAFITRELAEPDDLLREAVAFFDGRGLPFIARVRQGVCPAAEAAAARLGLTLADSVPGMTLADLQKAPRWAADLRIEVVDSEDRLKDFCRVVAESFGAPVSFVRRMVSHWRYPVPDVEAFVGYVEGRAVGSSLLATSSRVGGIYNVGTVPGMRRRGIGEAMTWKAVKRSAEQGAVIVSLQASDMGKPVYERMGFRVTALYRTFQRQPRR